MVRATWLKSVHSWIAGRAPLRAVRRRTAGRGNFAAEIRTLDDRVMLSSSAPDLWTEVESFPATAREVSYLSLSDFTALTVNETALRQTLDAAPDQSAWNFSVDTGTIALADPEGNLQRFSIYESQVMSPELAAQFPEIKTYSGKGIDDPTASVQLDLTPQGFHAQVLSQDGRWYVDPYFHLNDDFYASYYSADASASAERFGSLGGDVQHELDTLATKTVTASADTSSSTAGRSGTQLRTYRTAVAATGEYTAFHGGTVALGQAAIVTAMNRVTGIYENELSIRFQLVGNNSSLVYTNSATDPYTNEDGGAMLDENQTNVDAVIGNSNYDIGHVFSTGGGGVAFLGSVGINSIKAGGVTGLNSPTGDVFWVDFVAHEVGHQFGGEHTFNTSADPQRAAISAYEPGSGSTIQAYAGIISPASENLQNNSDAYFHSRSFDEMIAHVDNVIPLVGTRTATGNSVPTVNAGGDFTIPTGTPFILTASGSDGNGDTLVYNWEQRDLGAAQLLTDADNGASPLFRSFTPTTNPSRTFPSLSTVLGGPAIKGEKLPSVARAMDFRATVRDNRAGGGGVNTDDMIVNVVNTGAAFAITSQNSGGTFDGNSSQTITWNVAGTTANGINTANVRILLSTDGGNTFGTVISNSTANDGTETISMPNIATTQARIKVEAVGNIFFDINNANFTINSVNAPPVVPNQSFSVAPGAANGTVVGTVTATDPENQPLSYFIFSGNTDGAFDIDFNTGVITVVNSSAVTLANSPFNLEVEVSDGFSFVVGQVTITVQAPNTPPTIGGAVAGQTMNDTQTRAVFSTLTVTDPNTQAMTATINIQNGVVRGDFTAATSTAVGWGRTVVGNDIRYARTFPSAANIGSVVQTAIRALIFDPRENARVPNTTETTVFGVTVTDGVAAPVSNNTTSVIVTSLNNNVALSGQTNKTVNDNATVNPFSDLVVTDPDFQEGNSEITILNGVVRGDFTPASRAGWTRTVIGNNIRYFRYFGPGANMGATAQAAIRALVFQPRQNAILPGTTELTDFQIIVRDGVGPAATNVGNLLRVTTISVNDGPAIGGAVAGQTMNDNQTKLVFSTVTITDADRDDMLVTVTISNGTIRGDFTAASATGWTKTTVGNDFRYVRSFLVANNIGSVVQTAIRALNFQPRTNVPIGTTETTGFTILVNDGTANSSNNTTTVITTGVAPRPAAAEIVESDIATVILSALKKPEANPLLSLLKRKR